MMFRVRETHSQLIIEAIFNLLEGVKEGKKRFGRGRVKEKARQTTRQSRCPIELSMRPINCLSVYFLSQKPSFELVEVEQAGNWRSQGSQARLIRLRDQRSPYS